MCTRLASSHSAAWTDHLEYALGSTSLMSPVAALVAPRHWPLLRAMWARSGALGATRLMDWLDAKLRQRLGKAAGGAVTFADIDMPLVLVAANLSLEKMTLFQRDTHETMPLAAAAMASAAYPFVFRPQMHDGDAFVDGGIVSNFPAWALDEVRNAQPDFLPTFGFRVIDAPLPESATWPAGGNVHALQGIRRIVTTATFGREVLDSRRIDDLHPIEVMTAIKATDFHLVERERAGLYRAGRDQVHAYFRQNLGPRDRPAMTRRLRRCIDIVRDITGERGRIRAYLVQPIDAVFARVVHSALYDTDADDALVLRRDGENQALCMARRNPCSSEPPQSPTPNGDPPPGSTSTPCDRRKSPMPTPSRCSMRGRNGRRSTHRTGPSRSPRYASTSSMATSGCSSMPQRKTSSPPSPTPSSTAGRSAEAGPRHRTGRLISRLPATGRGSRTWRDSSSRTGRCASLRPKGSGRRSKARLRDSCGVFGSGGSTSTR